MSEEPIWEDAEEDPDNADNAEDEPSRAQDARPESSRAKENSDRAPDTGTVVLPDSKTAPEEVVNPNALSPTYSMVSYCPFMGKCCFYPMNLNILSLGITPCADNCTTLKAKTKNIWEDKVRVNVDCDITPAQQQSKPEPEVRKVKPRKKTLDPLVEEPVPGPSKPAVPGPPCPPGQVEVQVCTKTRNAATGTDERTCEMFTMPLKQGCGCSVDAQGSYFPPAPVFVRQKTPPPPPVVVRRERSTPPPPPPAPAPVNYPTRGRSPSEIFSKHQIMADVNLDLIRKESQASVRGLQPGISGMKIFIDEQTKSRPQVPNMGDLYDFIDYFSKKDGCKYIGILEQIFIEYFEKTKTDILFGANDVPDLRSRAEKSRNDITEIFKIVQVEEEKQLQDYDFPAALEKDCQVFEIDYMSKVMLIGKLHNYGVKMILYWIRLLETRKKEILPERVYDVGTELMADVMVICYGLFTKIADFLVSIAEHPTERQLQSYSLEFFIRAFRHLVDCICDEIGAIGESCGQVMIRIPNITRQKVIDIMTLLYKQVNFAHLSVSRAMEAIAPVLHLYHIRYGIMIGYTPKRTTNNDPNFNSNPNAHRHQRRSRNSAGY